MDFLDLVTISERTMELINPTSEEKILKLGRFLRLKKGDRVIDFGCGYGEALVLWAEAYGISGVGIELRQAACDRARDKVRARGFSDRIEIVCGDGADYQFELGFYDAATSIGTSFIWGGFQPTVGALKKAIKKDGRLAVGEPYWRFAEVPQAVRDRHPDIQFELELLQAAREEGFDMERVIRASQDDWDRYESDNWHGLVLWLEENRDHPEWGQVYGHLRQIQDEYLGYDREHFGWAIMVLKPSFE